MTQEQLILFKRSLNIYNTETEAWTALDNLTHIQGQPVVAFFRRNSNTHGDTALGAIFAIGTANGVGKYKACSSHDDMFAVEQALNTHISEWTSFKTTFDKMFEYDANHKAIKAKLDFYTDSNKNISAGGLGGSGSSSLSALYQLIDVMINSTGDGVEGAVEGSVLAYDATAGKWKAIAQSEILPDMSGYYTKDETNSAINTAKSNLQGQVDTLKALIPATASTDNQLADKDFVNSSIATATAEFRGSFTSLDELKVTSGNLNDYAFYLHKDSIGNSIVDRYKWTTAGWLYEYTLNNSSFTAEQWAALNSAITATLVNSYNSHLNNTTIHITSAERTAWNNKWDYNEETIKGVKVNAAVLSDKATKLATARKIWGKRFDGSDDVSGDLIDVGNISASGKATIQGDIVCGGEVVAVVGEGTPAGVTDYSALTGKPSINGVTLVSGNNTLAALGIQAAGDYATNSGVTTLLANYADKTFVSNNYVGKSAFNNHTADTDIHITATERAAWNAKWDYNEATIKAVKVNSASSADSVAWSGISGKPSTFTPSAHTHTASEVTGLPTSLKNPNALTFGSKTYDGSAAATITASDLGALTAHQSIYALTLQVNSVSQGTYNPASAAKTINIAVPTKTSDITNDSGFITSAAIPTALKNPYAVEIKANGVSLGTYDGSAAATFNLSAANVGAASKVHSHTASEISGLPTALSAFTNDVGYITGITKAQVEGVLTGDITSHTHTFASLASKPTTLSGYGITDALIRKYIVYKYDFQKYVILLCKVGTNTTNIGHTINGTFWTTNAGAERYQAAYINVHCSDWKEGYNEYYGFTSFGLGDKCRLVTCTYQSSQYLAITFESTQNTLIYFDGSYTNILFTPILYYTSYPSTVNNSEIYNSITEVSYNKIPIIPSVDTALTTANYNSYAPTLTGTGASGTWGISISGNAASATKLQTPRTIWGKLFDGTSDVNGDAHITGDLIVDGEVSALVA